MNQTKVLALRISKRKARTKRNIFGPNTNLVIIDKEAPAAVLTAVTKQTSPLIIVLDITITVIEESLSTKALEKARRAHIIPRVRIANSIFPSWVL